MVVELSPRNLIFFQDIQSPKNMGQADSPNTTPKFFEDNNKNTKH